MGRVSLTLLSLVFLCSAADERCSDWAAMGECVSNPVFMRSHCEDACAATECARHAVVQCSSARHMMDFSCPGLCEALGWLAPVPACESDASSCNATALAAEVASANALDSCMRRAAAGECEQGALAASCPLSCAQRAAWDCAEWAAQGECEVNGDWMERVCTHACHAVGRREECSEAVCSGLQEVSESCAMVSGGGVLEAQRLWASRWPSPYVNRREDVPVHLTVRNDLSVPAQLFYSAWTSPHEMGYGVLAPGARRAQEGKLGDRWRFRALAPRGASPASGALLREVIAGVLTVRPCACGPHARMATDYPPEPRGSTNETSVAIAQVGVPSKLVVLQWNGSMHVPVGSIWPAASRAVKERNSSHQLIVRGLQPGDLVSVVRAADLLKMQREGEGEGMGPVVDSADFRHAILMQHLQTDLVLMPCGAEVGVSPARRERLSVGDARAARAASERRERALEKERRQLQADNTELRKELERLQKLASLGEVAPDEVERHIASATDTLARVARTEVTRKANGGASSAMGGAAQAKGGRVKRKRNAPRRKKRNAPLQARNHDELR